MTGSRAFVLRGDDVAGEFAQQVTAKWPNHLSELDVALHTGLRRSEMYGLDWEDVNLANGYVRVKRGKNGDARYVRLNAAASKALTQLQKDQDQTGPVFAGRTGARLQSGRHWFENAVEDAGIDNFHWHDLRPTFASRLAMAGVGIRAIQELLGHKSLAMTVRYSHLSPDFQQEAVDKLVPPQPQTDAENRTDTEQETSAESSAKAFMNPQRFSNIHIHAPVAQLDRAPAF